LKPLTKAGEKWVWLFPHGVLFRGSNEGKIRQKTVEENILEAVIGLPANLFSEQVSRSDLILTR
jgi:type I restriction enzyme M protein